MELKRQRLDIEVGKKTAEISRVKKASEAVKKEIATVNAKLYADRTSNEQMDRDNLLIQNEFIALLKVSFLMPEIRLQLVCSCNQCC